MSVVPATIGRWAKWRTKRHAIHESGTKTLCGYDVGANAVDVPPPITWAEHTRRRENNIPTPSWFENNPSRYCDICLRIMGYG